MIRPDWFDPEQFPVESRWVDIDGSTVHYVDEGNGPVLLMLHGNPTWSFLYRRLISGLSGSFRCVAIDYPGFGLSTAGPRYRFTAAEHAEIVGRFVEELDLRDITLVVQDWGGPIGMAVATTQPERFAGFVVGNTWAWPRNERIVRVLSTVMGGSRLGDLTSRRLNLFVHRLIPLAMERRTLTTAERAMYEGPFPTRESRTPVQVFPRELVAARRFLAEVEGRLPLVADRPTLFLWADRDRAFPAPVRARWARILPRHETWILRGAGHFWQDDAGEEAALVIRDWWGLRG